MKTLVVGSAMIDMLMLRCWGQKPYYSTLKILHKSLSFA